MCKFLDLKPPFSILDKWINAYFNPEVVDLSIQDKRGSTEQFCSFGINLTLRPRINTFYTPNKTELLTLGNIPDTVLSTLMQGEPSKFAYLESFEIFKEAWAEEKVKEFLANPSQDINYNTPRRVYTRYPDMCVAITYRPFTIEFCREAVNNPEMISQFLYFKAMFLKSDLGVFRESQESCNKISMQYIEYLFNILSRCKVVFEEKT